MGGLFKISSKRIFATALVVASSLCWATAPSMAQQETPEEELPGEPPPDGAASGLTPEQEEELFRLGPESDEDEDEEVRVRGRTRGRSEDLGKMSDEELKEAGFAFGAADAGRDRSGALLMAALPGLVVHGLGHFSIKDYDTTVFLMSMEFVGLGLMGIGAGVPFILRGESANTGYARPLFTAGLGAVIASYILDIAGVVRGTDPLIYETPLKRRGGTLRIGYTFYSTQRYPLDNLLTAMLNVRGARFFGGAGTDQDVSLETSRYRAEVGARLFSSEVTEDQLYVRGRGGLWQFRGDGRYEVWRASALVGGTLDLAIVSPRLARIYLGGEVGWERQWYRFPVARSPEEDVDSDVLAPLELSLSIDSVPFEMYGGMNLTDKLTLQLAYTRRDGELLHDISRLFAVPSATIIYASSDRFDVVLDAAYGAGFRIGGQLRYWLW